MGNMDENAEIKLVEKGFITDSNQIQKIFQVPFWKKLMDEKMARNHNEIKNFITD